MATAGAARAAGTQPLPLRPLPGHPFPSTLLILVVSDTEKEKSEPSGKQPLCAGLSFTQMFMRGTEHLWDILDPQEELSTGFSAGFPPWEKFVPTAC